MMYHFMFGLRGGSVVAAAPSAAGACGSPAVLVTTSSFSWSCIDKMLLPGPPVSGATRSSAISLVILEKTKQSGHAVLNDEIDHGKVQRENEDGNHDHCGRSPD